MRHTIFCVLVKERPGNETYNISLYLLRRGLGMRHTIFCVLVKERPGNEAYNILCTC